MNKFLRLVLITVIAIVALFVLVLSNYLKTDKNSDIVTMTNSNLTNQVNRNSNDTKLLINPNSNTDILIPEIFRVNLGRPEREEDFTENRISIQRQWITNLAKSDYKKSIKKKKLLVTSVLNGGFHLNDGDRNLVCHDKVTNMSEFCEIVEDKWYNPTYTNYDGIDAVLFRRDWVYQFYEPKVAPSIKTVFSIYESPHTVHQGDFSVNNPILVSYWRGSDIVIPYYLWEPHEGNQEQKSLEKKNYATGKNKLAAMIVSHCPTANDRLGYAEELRKYVPVDIYGECGFLLTCQPLGAEENNCFDMIKANYKFYLAFENANCRDYITEKFFRNALQYDTVPIVYGAHPDDYKAAAPPNSYIHVEDFQSPKELAEYLLILDQNDELYNEYFKWKQSGRIVYANDDELCRICAFLFYADFHPPKKWPKDSRWITVDRCLPPKQYYWNKR